MRRNHRVFSFLCFPLQPMTGVSDSFVRYLTNEFAETLTMRRLPASLICPIWGSRSVSVTPLYAGLRILQRNQ